MAQQPNPLLEGLDYGSQLWDGLNTARGISQYGQHEMDPLVQPFSHGGVAPLIAGGALADLFKNKLMQNTSQGAQNTENIADTLAHLYGIMTTNQNRMGANKGMGWLGYGLMAAPAIIAALSKRNKQGNI